MPEIRVHALSTSQSISYPVSFLPAPSADPLPSFLLAQDLSRMDTKSPRHLLSVWNPAYAVDAIDAHISMLVERARAHRQGEIPEDDVHVWWGRIRSQRRQDELPHLADVLELEDQIADEIPTYLYLTDYSSLYVADLARITVDEIRSSSGNAVPSYYGQQECDLWFQIWDIRRLVVQDTRAVVEELGRLRNTRYHDQPVSLYGGMVELPLVVWRDSEVDWFGSREALTEGLLWAERDAEYRSEASRLSADLRDNLFGTRIWGLMEPATRTFLVSAEAVVRARRDDPVFDFAGPAVEYAKAVETEVNAVLFPLLRKGVHGLPAREQIIHVNGRELDLGRLVPHQTLGTLRRLLLDEPTVKKALGRAGSRHVTYFTDAYKLPGRLERVQELRNPAAHGSEVTRDEVLRFREELLGIGRVGLLLELLWTKEVE